MVQDSDDALSCDSLLVLTRGRLTELDKKQNHHLHPEPLVGSGCPTSQRYHDKILESEARYKNGKGKRLTRRKHRNKRRPRHPLLPNLLLPRPPNPSPPPPPPLLHPPRRRPHRLRLLPPRRQSPVRVGPLPPRPRALLLPKHRFPRRLPQDLLLRRASQEVRRQTFFGALLPELGSHWYVYE